MCATEKVVLAVLAMTSTRAWADGMGRSIYSKRSTVQGCAVLFAIAKAHGYRHSFVLVRSSS